MMQSSPNQVPPLHQLNIFLSSGYSFACHGHWNTIDAAILGSQQQSFPANTLSVDTITSVLNEAVPLGLERLRLTGVTNITDPLLYPALDELLEQIAVFNVSMSVETHGTGLRLSTAVRLARFPRGIVRILLAGASAAVHDGLLSAPGSYITATDAARQLAEQGVAVELLFPVVRHNAAQVPAVIRLAEQLGVQSLLFIAVSPLNQLELHGRSSHRASELFKPLTVEELIALGRKVERQYQPQARVTLLFDQPPAFQGLHPSARVDGRHGCAVTNNLSLLPNGSYALCGMSVFGGENTAESEPNTMILGLAGHDRLDAVWREHRMLAALREGQPVRLAGVCERCAVQSACLGRCPIENHQRTGSFWGPYWFCEAAERAGLFPAGRLIENRWL